MRSLISVLRPTSGLLAAVILLAATAACVPAIPRSSNVAPVARGAQLWRVEPGDILRLRNWGGGLDQTLGEIIVNDDGEVLIPSVGRLRIAGLRPDSVEQIIIARQAVRVDSSRVEVTFLRPIAVVGGVRTAGVQLTDPTATVLSLIARSGGPTRPGGDVKVYVLRVGQEAREVSTADRLSDLDVRAADQLYVQDPPFVIRNAIPINSAFQLLQLLGSVFTLYYLVRRG